jgi:uncharacterized protein (TIGR02217 family)
MPNPFHEISFPLAVAVTGKGGPERKTDIVVMGSGREERNARWVNSRRSYDAGTGVKSLSALAEVIAFFEERRGRLYGFRFRDRADWKSCLPSAAPTALDQTIGTGDATTANFQLVKTYGSAFAPYSRAIAKPVSGTVLVAVGGVTQTAGVDFNVDSTTGNVGFVPGRIPAAGAIVTAGYQFDVPVRFDTDKLEIDLSAFVAGAAPSIPIVEIVV